MGLWSRSSPKSNWMPFSLPQMKRWRLRNGNAQRFCVNVKSTARLPSNAIPNATICAKTDSAESVHPSPVSRSQSRQVWDVASDLLMATALIWALPLLLGIAGAVVNLLVKASWRMASLKSF
jgi:hypothetical protein